MKINVQSWIAGAALVSALVLSTCGSGATDGNNSADTLNVSVTGEQLKFDQSTLAAKANTPVRVTLKNGSTAQQHNWVLVRDEAAAEQVATAAASNAGEPAADSSVLAKTPMAAPGATVNTDFTTPPAGSYVYVCTVPGHFQAGMKGTLNVA